LLSLCAIFWQAALLITSSSYTSINWLPIQCNRKTLRISWRDQVSVSLPLNINVSRECHLTDTCACCAFYPPRNAAYYWQIKYVSNTKLQDMETYLSLMLLCMYVCVICSHSGRADILGTDKIFPVSLLALGGNCARMPQLE
jgi:hypothetical protein